MSIIEYRLQETQPLLVVALHEAQKRMEDPACNDREFYGEYILRLKACITDNSAILHSWQCQAKPANAHPDFGYRLEAKAVHIVPLTSEAVNWLRAVCPPAIPVKLDLPTVVGRELGAELMQQVAAMGEKLAAQLNAIK